MLDLNASVVALVLRLMGLATSLLALLGRESFRLLTWPLVAPLLGLTARYQLARDIAERVSAVLELTAADSVRAAAGARLGGPGAARDAPEPVRRYLEYALREGTPPLKCACLRQSGWFRFLPGTPAASAAAPGGAEAAGGGGKEWKPLRAEAYVSVGGRPGLVWSATIQLAPLQWVRGFASYLRGRGSTRWKLCTLWRVHDVEGERSLDTLSLLRFLAEAPCYPTALLPSQYLKWEPIDATSARAVITDAGVRASAVFRFNAVGQVVAMRSTDGGGAGRRDPYCCYYRRYARMGSHGLRIPTEVEAAWELPGGEYSFAQLEAEELSCWDTLEMPGGHED